MIKITKNYNRPPKGFHLCDEDYKKEIFEAVKNKSGKKKDKDGKMKRIDYYKNAKDRLKKLYHKKCAYCESKSEHVSSLEVEHYRGVNRVIKGDLLKSEQGKHKGYYWLVCEWSNLLLACSTCNRKKGNHFPIQGIRVLEGSPFDEKGTDQERIKSFDRSILRADQPPLKDEEPLLLNPEEAGFDPNDHFQFTPLGRIQAKIKRKESGGKTIIESRGEITIDICNLNRWDLSKKRQDVILEPLLKDIKKAIKGVELGKYKQEVFEYSLEEAFDDFQKKLDPKEEYSFYATYLLKHFEECVINLLGVAFQGAVLKVFNTWQQKANYLAKNAN